MVDVKIYNVSSNKLPKYETKESAGMDVRVDFSRNSLRNTIKVFGEGQFVPANEVQKISCLYLEPGSRAMIPTGLFVSIPHGYEIQLRPRSGLALKEGITMINTPGTIDADYRGECNVLIINTSKKTCCIEDGERIGQFVLNKIEQISWNEVFSKDDLGTTERGEGGMGHTGKN